MTVTPREDGLGALHCPVPGFSVSSSNLLNGPRMLHSAHFSEGATEAQRGQRALGHTVGGRAEARPTPYGSTPPGLAPVPLWDFAWDSRAHAAGLKEEGPAEEAGGSAVQPCHKPQAEDAGGAGKGTQPGGEAGGHQAWV